MENNCVTVDLENSLANISNEDVEISIDRSIYNSEEENNLIARYGRNDMYLYAMRLDYLNAISIVNTEDGKIFFHKSLASLGDTLGKDLLEIGDNYTLLKYLGNDKFKEFYTGKVITIYRNRKENFDTFLPRLEEYRKNPLCVLVGLNDLVIASKEIEDKLIDNAKNRDRIIEFINTSFEYALRDLNKDFENLINDDYIYAKEEDRVYEFKKTM